MLQLSHISKNYGKFCAVRDISLELEDGLYGMLAPNGAGKTTLIKMIVTLLYPTEGTITYDGIEIQKMGENYRDLIGYLPQQFGYYKNQSPVQYLNYLAALKAVPKEGLKEKIKALLELVGLSESADKKMKKFSGGMIQRVGIAQALLNDPKILILDEPTAGLDPKERARFRNLISSLSRNRIVILSTHIVSDIESIANQVIMIKDKKLLLIDDSIVRGTQLRETTEFLYESGAKEVHIRPACPPLVYGCKYLNFSRSSSEMDLITRRVIAKLEGTDEVPNEVLQQYTDPNSEKYDQMIEEIRKELKFTSLQYNRLDDMLESVGIPVENLCTYCWDGKE